MRHTENYNFNLYDPTDLANLTDGYNNSMEKIDSGLKAVEDYVQTQDAAIEQNAADIVAEKTRAVAAEKAVSDAVSAESTRAKGVESTLTTNLNAEITRAKAAESKNATAVSTETTRAKNAENELATGVSNAITQIGNEVARAKSAELNMQLYNVFLYGAEYDNVDSINNAITAMMNAGLQYVYFPAGDYHINKTINIGTESYYFYGVCGDGSESRFFIESGLDLVFNCNIHGREQLDGFIKGLTILSNGAFEYFGTAIKNAIGKYYGLLATNLYIQNARECIRLVEDNASRYTGLILSDSFFIMQNKIGQSYIPNNTKCLIVGTDNFISNCRISGYDYGICGWNIDATQVIGCYFWQSYATFPIHGIYQFLTNAANYRVENSVSVNDCYFDGIPYPYVNIALHGNNNYYYFNIRDMKYDGTNHEYVIWSTGYSGTTFKRTIYDSGVVRIGNASEDIPCKVSAIDINSENKCGAFFDYDYKTAMLAVNEDTFNKYDIMTHNLIINGSTSEETALQVFAIGGKSFSPSSNQLRVSGTTLDLITLTSGKPVKTTYNDYKWYYEIVDGITYIYVAKTSEFISLELMFASNLFANGLTIHPTYYNNITKPVSSLTSF